MPLKLSFVAFFLLLALGSVSWAHSVHQSTAEAEFNERSQHLEVSLTVFLNDLEVALIRQCECEMRWGRAEKAEIEKQARLYLDKHFRVSDAHDHRLPISWVGCQLDETGGKGDETQLTLYFEVPMPGGLGGTRLQNTVFCDLFEDQANWLHLIEPKKKSELLFNRKVSTRDLKTGDPVASGKPVENERAAH